MTHISANHLLPLLLTVMTAASAHPNLQNQSPANPQNGISGFPCTKKPLTEVATEILFYQEVYLPRNQFYQNRAVEHLEELKLAKASGNSTLIRTAQYYYDHAQRLYEGDTKRSFLKEKQQMDCFSNHSHYKTPNRAYSSKNNHSSRLHSGQSAVQKHQKNRPIAQNAKGHHKHDHR
jgi:hypothetical protein